MCGKNKKTKTPCYCMHIRRAANRITELYDQKLRPFSITVNQFSILAQLDVLSGCGIGKLAEQLELNKSTLARTVQPLLKAGYIENTAPEGQRPVRLRLTASGEDLFTAAFPAWKQAQADVRASLRFDAEELMHILSGIG